MLLHDHKRGGVHGVFTNYFWSCNPIDEVTVSARAELVKDGDPIAEITLLSARNRVCLQLDWETLAQLARAVERLEEYRDREDWERSKVLSDGR